MTEFEFFKERADRWGNSMQALWGSLGICPPTDHIGLPHHTAGELHSIGHLKVWGDAQKLHLGMAYLLVQVDVTSEAGNYGMAIVWIDSHQARMVMMGKLWRCYLPSPPKDPTDHMFSSSCMKAPTIHPSPKIDMFVSFSKGRQKAQVGR